MSFYKFNQWLKPTLSVKYWFSFGFSDAAESEALNGPSTGMNLIYKCSHIWVKKHHPIYSAICIHFFVSVPYTTSSNILPSAPSEPLSLSTSVVVFYIAFSRQLLCVFSLPWLLCKSYKVSLGDLFQCASDPPLEVVSEALYTQKICLIPALTVCQFPAFVSLYRTKAAQK